jgi:hypothetical protein
MASISGISGSMYRHFENILFELGPVDYNLLSIFILCNTII